MKLNLTAAQKESLLRYLNESPDAEQLSNNEYVADFYDVDEPITVNFLVTEDGAVEIAAAAQLLYDETEDGWYMGERLERPEDVLDALARAGALGE